MQWRQQEGCEEDEGAEQEAGDGGAAGEGGGRTVRTRCDRARPRLGPIGFCNLGYRALGESGLWRPQCGRLVVGES